MTPSVQIGQKRGERRNAKAAFESLKTPEAWSALSAAGRWEIVRKVLVVLLRREFDDSTRPN